MVAFCVGLLVPACSRERPPRVDAQDGGPDVLESRLPGVEERVENKADRPIHKDAHG